MKVDKGKKYSAVSLVEMLLTMIIITIVMLLVATTLTTMVRTSIISTARTAARQESEFILELLRKTVRNSSPDEIKIYSVTGRSFDMDSGRTVDEGVTGYESPAPDGGEGTEIHFRPFGYDKWVCIAYFPLSDGSGKGTILKSVRRDLLDGSECFNPASPQYIANTIVLNSEEISVNSLKVQFFSTFDENYLLTIDLDVEPERWIPNRSDIKPNYFQQTVVSTQKLTWED
jgi:type II secretory pathway pseudopilin PulG